MYNFKVKSKVHDYEVQFINDTATTLKNELKDGDIVIIDEKVKRLYADELDIVLTNNKTITIEANEKNKSYRGLIPIIEYLIDSGFRKNYRLFGIGGGIIQDITAFTASIIYRGVDWVFFPTTLLAQGDSCIGSKTSINFGEFKNQVGGFYPPEKVFINLQFLNTLSNLDIKSGLGEMAHYFIVAGEVDFIRYKNEYHLALVDKKVLAGIIARSLEIKILYIEIDEFDRKERQVFNYGHSFGHAIESLTNYRIPHGIAVSYGMDMANYVSVKLGYIPDEIRQNIRELLEKIWAGTHINDISFDKFKLALSKDKKNVGKELRLILNKGYGKIFKDSLTMDNQLSGWLNDYFKYELK
jgi:3-dehydroquinate synthase